MKIDTVEDAHKRLTQITGFPDSSMLKASSEHYSQENIDKAIEWAFEKWHILYEYPEIVINYHAKQCALCWLFMDDDSGLSCTGCPLYKHVTKIEENRQSFPACYRGENGIMVIRGILISDPENMEKIKEAVKKWGERMRKEVNEWKKKRAILEGKL